MKKVFTILFFAILMTFGLQAQGKKVVLIEHFTQASCGPCATQNPRIRPIVESNSDKIAMIHHQTSWPGFDPMNNHNKRDVATRVSYYGVRGVPNTVMNGRIQGSPSAIVTQANVDQQYNQQSQMEIDLQVEGRCNFTGLDINIDVNALEGVSGDLALHVVVIEEEISFNSPPGTNGETVFHHVLKKALPTDNGTSMKSDWANGDKESFSFSYDFENFYNFREAGVVAFIQDRSSKVVYQASHWKAEFEESNGDDIAVQNAWVDGDQVCGNTAAPIVTVMNTGNSNVTSFEVEYSINGSKGTHSWSQRVIGKFRTAEVQLPAISFSPKSVNDIQIKVLSTNGSSDVESCNDQIGGEFAAAPTSTNKSTFRIYPRIRPADLSFEIVNSQNQVIAEGSGFTNRNQWVEYSLDLDMDECYEIKVTNAASLPNALFELVNENDVVIVKGNVATQGLHTEDFGTYMLTSSRDLHEVSDMTLSPNPGINEFIINAEVIENLDVQIVVTDILGKTYSSTQASWTSGQVTEKVDMSSVPSGLYLVTIKNGQRLMTKRWLKN